MQQYTTVAEAHLVVLPFGGLTTMYFDKLTVRSTLYSVILVYSPLFCLLRASVSSPNRTLVSPSIHLLKVSRLVENMISVAPDAFAAEHGRPSKTDPDLTLVYALMLIVGHGRTDHKFAHLQ